jgi:hypothetical protein
MKNYLTIIFLCVSIYAFSQLEFEPADDFPYRKPNPEVAQKLKDFHPLIGECDCKSVLRNPDGTWANTANMVWKFKYIMNGNAIQDETFKEDYTYAGSIRQFNSDSSKWYVHYYSSAGATGPLSTWEGGLKGDDIILYKDQTAPNGMEGKYKITFFDISEFGFNWLGEWVDKAESFSFPTWKIFCTKKE